MPCVNHKDLNRSNNTVDNLEWITYKDNEIHSRKYGTVKEYKPFKVIFNNGDEKIFESKQELANILNITKASVQFWLHNKNKGYKNHNIKEIYYV